MIKKQSMIELISNTEWMPLEKIRGLKGKSSFEENTVYLLFHKGKKDSKSADKVLFKFGPTILDKLGWKRKDKICIYNNPDNLLQMKVVKSDSGVGYSLAIDATFPFGGFQFAWPYSSVCPLEKKKRFVVAHEIFNGKILLVDANL